MTDDLDTLLSNADPWRPLPVDVAAEHSVAVAREIIAVGVVEASRARAVRRRQRIVAAVLGAAVLVPTTAYAADRIFRAQTGEFGSGMGEDPDRSEWVDMCAPDLGALIAALPEPSGSLPAGQSWAQVRQRVAQRSAAQVLGDCPPRGAGVRQQVVGLRASLLFEGQSSWACEALRADRRNDPAGVRVAGEHIAGLFDELNALHVLGDNAWRPIRDKVGAGDLTAIKDFFAANGTAACP